MIQLLPVEVRDQIAAGEVVERPAHMVKELVENSLDAGASQVTIRVKDSGRTVEIQDNGHGIAAEQLGLALDRFATSKITTSEDLWRLKTYGFRGEALASLAAVSKLTLISRTAEKPQASRIQSVFGQKSPVDQVSGEKGTRLIIENLFENVPARLKFLKSEAAEHTAIKNVVKAMALTRHDVEFRYFENDKLVFLYAPVKSSVQRAQQVLDLSPLYTAEEKTHDGWSVEIHFAGPHQVAKTAKNIWIFVQGRHVQDRALQTALMDAYRSLLMHGEYPISIVSLRVPEDQVDVNIHPTKSQVKFVDSSQAFRFVHHTIREKLESAPWVPQRTTLAPAAPERKPEPVVVTPHSLKFQDQAFNTTHYRKKEDVSFQKVSLQDLEKAAPPKAAPVVEAPPVVEEKKRGYWSGLQVVGQVGLTYIVTQDESKMILVDQHAAHERVAFERLMKAWHGGRLEVQEFLFPLALDFSAPQVEALMTQSDSLKKLGVSLELLGPSTVGIKSAPTFVKEAVFAQVLEKMADEVLDKGGSFQFEKKVVDICATWACHSVVRAGQALSISEMKSLLEQMDEFPLSSFCPHGRPVSVEWTLAHLEKEFGRRV